MQSTALRRSCYEYHREWLSLLPDAGHGAPLAESFATSIRVDGKEIVHQRHNRRRNRVSGIQLYRLEKLSSSVSPTSGMYHSRPTDLIISRVSVSLQNAFELPQEPLRTVPSATQSEVEYHSSSGATILPKITLVILPSALVHLYIHRSFIGLDVRSVNQLSPHGGDHRDQQLADFEDPAVQRCAADFQVEVPFQNHALPMQGRVIAIFTDDRLGDYPVTRQALLDDPGRQGR